MKANGISVLVSKKIGRSFNSWSISYGVTGDLEAGESYEAALKATEARLRALVTQQLPTPESVQAEIAKANGKKVAKLIPVPTPAAKAAVG